MQGFDSVLAQIAPDLSNTVVSYMTMDDLLANVLARLRLDDFI